ncbi:MAG: hypothetical protein WCA78_06120 [Rhizomicrobium sp.]|jgi:hypothetical protein
MMIFRVMLCGMVLLGLTQNEPNLGFGRPGALPPFVTTIRETIMERLHLVKIDLAAHSLAAMARSSATTPTSQHVREIP